MIAGNSNTPRGSSQAHEPNGLSLDQFNTHPSTIFTVAEFSKAVVGVEDFCKGRLEKAGVTVPARG